MIDLLSTSFGQRALLEGLLLAVIGGVLGSWIVLRRLAFFAHAAGSAAFPGLVVAGPWGIAPQLGALGAALGMAGGVEALSRGARTGRDAATGILLVGGLALGSVLAGDVYETGAGVDRLLFGTLLGISDTDIALTAIVAALVVAVDASLRRSWLATGFDPDGARALGVRTRAADRILLALVAAAVIVAVDAVGALLVAAVLVLPAATVRLVARDVRRLQAGAVALAAVEAVASVFLADALNVAPGPALAVLGAAIFAVVAVSTSGRAA